jgi:hypothetical protein
LAAVAAMTSAVGLVEVAGGVFLAPLIPAAVLATVAALVSAVGPACVVMAGGAEAQARPVGVAVAGGVEVTPA